MPSQRIEDYALIGNCAGAALVGKNGSIDWLCIPRFDSPACFAALLGDEDNGRWQIAPKHPHPTVKRRYEQGTLVLETEFTTPEGTCAVVDCMAKDDGVSHVLRVIRGISGSVPMRMQLKIRTQHGLVVPWVTQLEDGRRRAIAGSDQFAIAASVEIRGEALSTVSEFTVSAGEEVSFSLTWSESHKPVPDSPDVPKRLRNVTEAWREWSSQHIIQGPYAEAVLRSLITLKALTDYETGGMVAAVTTSLPERIGGSRNWDYRYCWLRDATFTLYALINAGFLDEAKAWREWLLRAIAGSPEQMQILYGITGERIFNEFEIPWLSGYENSKPIRIGNAAAQQVQLDVFGEVVDLLYEAQRAGLTGRDESWDVERSLINHLGKIWSEPDSGLWEMRGPARHFTHSKAMAWLAVDRAIRSVEEFGAEGPVDEWRTLRDRIHEETCAKGFNRKLNSFVQYFGGDTLDASLLMLPLIGFLPPDDPRIEGTIAAVEKYLLRDVFVARYNTEADMDGVGGEEGAFLACSFWLADNYIVAGRRDEAKELFERLLGLCNDVGLLAEEYDFVAKRQVGNFPQAFSHVSLVNTAHNLDLEGKGPAHTRGGQGRSETQPK